MFTFLSKTKSSHALDAFVKAIGSRWSIIFGTFDDINRAGIPVLSHLAKLLCKTHKQILAKF